MHEVDLNKVVFYSKQDLSIGIELNKAEVILKTATDFNYSNINDILEIYNVKKYIDNGLYLPNWTQNDVTAFKLKVIGYGKAVGEFISNINDDNFATLYGKIVHCYIPSFWELVNNQNLFKKISNDIFNDILINEPNLIYNILIQKNIVEHYKVELKNFLLTYSKSAEILLSSYEVQNNFQKRRLLLPTSLNVADKENIIINYLDSDKVNFNYIEMILYFKNKKEFKISDKTRLKAKRLQKTEKEKIFAQNGNMKYGVSISFVENATKVKDGFIDDNLTAHYTYSTDFIKQNNDPYLLLTNFKFLFEYLDEQSRINLISKRNSIGIFEKLIGTRSQNQYMVGTSFSLSEMTSQGQIIAYSKILNEMKISIENILHSTFTISFREKYGFAENSIFSIPSKSNSFLEKIRLIAPEFESVLKQFKLFVEDGNIDFDLLQISSSPTSIKDIPSLNENKYIYFNEDNKEMVLCINLFFSDQTSLTFVDPFKEKTYYTFFELLKNEQVNYNSYEEHQKPELNYLIKEGLLEIDEIGIIQITNIKRLLIFKDLYENEFSSFYRYTENFQDEAQKLRNENIIFFESSLFSKPEQAYFNYFLNKSEFTNGLDLRNRYLHGTQSNPNEFEEHEFAYFIYLKLLVLTILKMDDDLYISKCKKI